MSLKDLTSGELAQAKREAQAEVVRTGDNRGLVHLMWRPGWDGKLEFAGISTPLPAGSNLAGYTGCPYYTLREVLAA